MMTIMLMVIFLFICGSSYASTIVTSMVFVIPITPKMFGWNWNVKNNDYSYQVSLVNAPDLPTWIHYIYSTRHHQGFLYGVAPRDQPDFQLEIIGLNKQTYETGYKILQMKVKQKQNITNCEVYLKIDNLNIEDTFDNIRMGELLNIFRNELWKEAQDLHITYLASAVEEGARIPLNPNEPEGVVLKIGSSSVFSEILNKFEEELRPLKKRFPCPKDYKRSSKEKLFRDVGFVLDWCAFKLITINESLHQESARRGSSMNVIGRPSSEVFEHTQWHWAQSKKSQIPIRNYFSELVSSIFIPTTLLLVMALLLSTTFCLNHEKLKDPESEKYIYQLFNIFQRETIQNRREKRESSPMENLGTNGIQYASIERGATLRSLSVQPSPHDVSQSPKASIERINPYIRPNPPPYTAPTNVGTFRVDF